MQLAIAQFFNRLGVVPGTTSSNDSRIVRHAVGDNDCKPIVVATRTSRSDYAWVIKKVDVPQQLPSQTRTDVIKNWLPFTCEELAPVVLPKIKGQLDYRNKSIKLDLEPYINPCFSRFHKGDQALHKSRVQD